jgi:exosortase
MTLERFEILYPLVFISTAVALGLLERVHALQRQPIRMARRWTSNIGLFISGNLIATAIVPIGIYGFALAQPPGPMTRLELPFAAQLVLTFVLLDFWRYWEHRVFHQVPLLWRLHLVHHSDTAVDITTSERHHPLDVFLGTATLMALIAVLGLPAAGVGFYLLVATVVAFYSHANLRATAPLDRMLRPYVVTASVHAVHHSSFSAQTDSNFGSVFTLWDRLFGTFVDPARARIPHFGLDYFHLAADTRFARVLLQPFLFRPSLDYPARRPYDDAADGTPVAASMTPASRDALAGAIAGSALVCLVMWPTLVEMFAVWRGTESYQYAWLVVPMIVYVLAGRHGAAGVAVNPRPDFSGVVVVVAAAVCWGAAVLMNIDVGRQFALVLAIHGVAMSALGWRAYWRLFPVLALMFLMIPSGDLLQPALRMLTVKAIELFAVVANLPHSVEGFVVFIGSHRYIVIDECSGLSYVLLAAFLGYCFGLLLYRSFARIAALALLGALLGFTSNMLRVDAIVLVDWLRDSQMDLGAHGVVQWIALLATLGLLFHVLSGLRGDAAVAPVTRAVPRRVAPARKLAPVTAGLCGLLIAGSATALPDADPRTPRDLHSPTFPATLAGWTRAQPARGWTVDSQHGTASVASTYEQERHTLEVVVTETLSPTAKLQPIAPAAQAESDWHEKQVRHESGCVPAGCVTFVHTTWQRQGTRELREVFYTYSVGNFTTDSRFAVRAAHGWGRLTESPDRPRMIAFLRDDADADANGMAGAYLALRSANDAPLDR